jgi:hypothetical protein
MRWLASVIRELSDCTFGICNGSGYRCGKIKVGRSHAELDDEVPMELVLLKVGIPSEEPCDFKGGLISMPGGHHKPGIDLILRHGPDKRQVQSVVPLFAGSSPTDCVPAVGAEEAQDERLSFGVVPRSTSVPE